VGARAVENDEADENGMFGVVSDDAWEGRGRGVCPTRVHPAARPWADVPCRQPVVFGGVETAPFASSVLSVPAANDGGIVKSARWKFEEQQMEPDDRMDLACRITTRSLR
jgi:hypothetical protein